MSGFLGCVGLCVTALGVVGRIAALVLMAFKVGVPLTLLTTAVGVAWLTLTGG